MVIGITVRIEGEEDNCWLDAVPDATPEEEYGPGRGCPGSA
jgi:hypothetical protein